MSKTQIILLWTRKGEKQMNIANYGCAVQACKTAEKDVKVSPKKKKIPISNHPVITGVHPLFPHKRKRRKEKKKLKENKGNKMVKYF